MNIFSVLIKRNIKLFFNDKGMFFTSLITPAILLVLYATFLGSVYKDSFISSLPDGFNIGDDIVNSYVGCQLASSILAVSCVSVAFCSNLLMVQDKANGRIKDFTISPVKPYIMAIGYYIATLISTLIICLAATGICLAYVASIGWYMSLADVFYLVLDVFLLVMFGTALSSIINFFLNSQGQMSAVGTIISAGYGFICGAYMPISQFSESLQKIIMFLPGTYGTSLIRNHAMGGVFNIMADKGFPTEVVESIKDSVDCNLYFFDRYVPVDAMYLILSVSLIFLVAIYVIMNILKGRSFRK